MAHNRLSIEIIALSFADNWSDAKREWALIDVYKEVTPDRCLCGRYPIFENCVLENSINGNRVVVGNTCVKKFLGLPSVKIFQAINRIISDNQKSLNAEAIEHAHRKGWITDWELKFCHDTILERVLSDKQLRKRIQINEKVLRMIARNRPGR